MGPESLLENKKTNDAKVTTMMSLLQKVNTRRFALMTFEFLFVWTGFEIYDGFFMRNASHHDTTELHGTL